ncbi:MAG: hypothetical protein RR068_17170 [Hafnia sp.]
MTRNERNNFLQNHKSLLEAFESYEFMLERLLKGTKAGKAVDEIRTYLDEACECMLMMGLLPEEDVIFGDAEHFIAKLKRSSDHSWINEPSSVSRIWRNVLNMWDEEFYAYAYELRREAQGASVDLSDIRTNLEDSLSFYNRFEDSLGQFPEAAQEGKESLFLSDDELGEFATFIDNFREVWGEYTKLAIKLI